MTVFDVPEVGEKGSFYYLKANTRALKRDVALVIWIKTDLSGEDIVRIYKARFQIEFVFRSAKQSTGLCHCQDRDKSKLKFAFNASLPTVNIAKETV